MMFRIVLHFVSLLSALGNCVGATEVVRDEVFSSPDKTRLEELSGDYDDNVRTNKLVKTMREWFKECPTDIPLQELLQALKCVNVQAFAEFNLTARQEKVRMAAALNNVESFITAYVRNASVGGKFNAAEFYKKLLPYETSFYRSPAPRSISDCDEKEEESVHLELLRAQIEQVTNNRNYCKKLLEENEITAYVQHRIFSHTWSPWILGKTDGITVLDLSYCDFSKMIPMVWALIKNPWPSLIKLNVARTKNTGLFLKRNLFSENKTLCRLFDVNICGSDLKIDALKNILNLMRHMDFEGSLRRGGADCSIADSANRFALITILTDDKVMNGYEVLSEKKWSLIKGIGQPVEGVQLKMKVVYEGDPRPHSKP